MNPALSLYLKVLLVTFSFFVIGVALFVRLLPQPSIYQLVNDYRASKNLPALIESPALDKSAEAKCEDMQSRVYFGHDFKDTTWDSFFPQTYQVMGENLARDYTDSRSVVEAWKASPSHNQNLLRDFRYVGYAVCTGVEGTLVVQHLAR